MIKPDDDHCDRCAAEHGLLLVFDDESADVLVLCRACAERSGGWVFGPVKEDGE
jgi:hypothetical protein